MQARLLIVGTELLAGHLDTNGPQLGGMLLDRGFDVRERLTLPDELGVLVPALRRALAEGGLVVTTGGLGPTGDDLTREAIEGATSRRLLPDPSVEEKLRGWARSLGRAEPGPESLRQALVPEGARVLENPAGTAPGLLLHHEQAVLLVLPGPPRELAAMAPAALDAATLMLRMSGLGSPSPPLVGAELRCTGLGESGIARLLADCPELEREGLEVAWLASPGQVCLRLRAREAEWVRAASAAARARLGEHVFCEDGRSLPEVVVSLLREREETVGTVESCTGGLVAAALSSVPGSSAALRAGLVVYANESKVVLAGVSTESIAAHGAVSREVVEALALGGRRSVQADWVLAVSGIAGPGGATADKPVGTVFTAVAGPDGLVESAHHLFPSGRELVRELSVAALLDSLRRRLLA